jgi:hypothetical protein
VLPDGAYKPVIRLVGDHRTITLPNVVRLDTTPPRPLPAPRLVRARISPNGDGRHDLVRIHYTLSAPGHAILLVNGRQAVFTRSQKIHGTTTWAGNSGGAARRQGTYRLSLEAQDAAGNRSAPTPVARVTIRYLALGRAEIAVEHGRRFALFVLTDARTVTWLLDRGRGTSRSHTLRIRAPRKPGSYTLYVTADGHTARAVVDVR